LIPGGVPFPLATRVGKYVQRSTQSGELVALLHELSLSDDLDGALQRLLRFAGANHSSDGTAAVICANGSLRVHAAPELEWARELPRSLDDPSPVATALRDPSLNPTTLSLPGGERVAVLPVVAGPELPAACAGLVVALRDGSDKPASGLSAAVELATPLLGRLAELDQLRRLERQRQLEDSPRAQGVFLSAMSHELRTPLHALLGYTALLQDRVYGELTAQQEQALERIVTASEQLLELVSDILDLARIEAGTMSVCVERIDLEKLTAEVSETIAPRAAARQLEYRVEIPPGLPRVETDPNKLKQILANLLSNAVKFTPAGSVVLRAAAPAGVDGIEISVTDTGIGIPAEELGAIFQDFRQVDQSSTREYGGTGLGLSIVRRLLELLRGSIRVTSAVGEGSTFTFRLPRRAPIGAPCA
jgi:signal transduction histidine kinase